MSEKTKGKLSLVGLALMIFTSVYGFNNIPRAFYMMGYGAIPWYLIGALGFFLPFAFMVTELGSAFKEEKGGIYSWMEKAVGPTFAFVGTLMWYLSYLVWMVNISSGIMAPLGAAIFGNASVINSLPPYVMSLIGVGVITLVTLSASFGMKAISKVSAVGGIAVLSLNAILLIGAIIVLIANGGHAATTLDLHALTTSANPTFDNTSIIGFFAFIVFAIFAYGGVEAVGGLVDETENPKKNFPKGVLISAVIIAIGYSLMILMVGIFMNYQTHGEFWEGVKASKYNFGNASYVIMDNLGQSLGRAFGANASGIKFAGEAMQHFMGLAIFLSLLGAFFTLIYSPAKQIISGTPDKLWPGKLGHIDEKTGMPRNLMTAQWAVVVIIILAVMLVNLGGTAGQKATGIFFTILTNMTNVAMTLPYMLITYAFFKFKFNDKINKPFTIYSKPMAVVATVASLLVVGFADVFTILQPLIQPDSVAGTGLNPIISFLTMILGPIIFAAVAIIMMQIYKANNPEEYAALSELSASETED
ncbi:MAG: glutamate/gamma-aminobutyrate family transporter YjeM [Streptococcaceae bacterium]|jgi:amino acid transporter|nr:glutamate/gamma-aminobutyrate family transporter YjeM [Streptococcaceae bacterium]